jgi:hypothetical protein
VSGVFAKKFGVGREERGIENFEDAREVDFSVFGVGMIAVDEEGGEGEDEQGGEAADGGFDGLSLRIHFRCA